MVEPATSLATAWARLTPQGAPLVTRYYGGYPNVSRTAESLWFSGSLPSGHLAGARQQGLVPKRNPPVGKLTIYAVQPVHLQFDNRPSPKPAIAETD